ncbi:MAG TPA: TolC family outer membrane protein [Burkholderiales bacterium]|nr:TolC family outer membrane protein [Burkholderiales bacterium]
MTIMPIRSFALTLALASFAAQAEDLVQVYRDAQRYDAQYAAARHALDAGRERLPQGEALLLPNIGLSAGYNYGDARIKSSRNDLLGQDATINRNPRDWNYTLSLTQPIFRKDNWLRRDQSEFQVKQAESTFEQSRQDLILRSAQAYFDVLAAQATLTVVKAQKVATAEQLAQAKRNFEVGTATITDTHEAQARYDLIVAQEIQAQNDLENRQRALQQITGKEYAALKDLRPDVKLAPPNPNNMQSWVELSEKQSYPVRIQEAVTEIAALEAKRGEAGHYPTLDAVASYRDYNQRDAVSFAAVGSQTQQATIGLQLALPLYQGGAISSRERETAALHMRAKEDLENARRASALAARQAFLAVNSGIAGIRALEQALVSSKSALESNKLGYEVGVRINIDVLNAQQQVFSTERDLALARYNTINNQLRLKSSAGSLVEDDLVEVNRALAP